MATKGKGPDMAFLAKMMAQYNPEAALSEEDIRDFETISDKKAAAKAQTTNELEGILRQLHYEHALIFKVCNHCNRAFQTHYCYHEYCSDECRYGAFKAQFGIEWKDLKTTAAPASFWKYEPVLTIQPDTVEDMYSWAKEFIEGYESIKARTANLVQTSPEDLASLPGNPPEPDSSSPSFELALTTPNTFDILSVEVGGEVQSTRDLSVSLSDFQSSPDPDESADAPFQL